MTSNGGGNMLDLATYLTSLNVKSLIQARSIKREKYSKETNKIFFGSNSMLTAESG